MDTVALRASEAFYCRIAVAVDSRRMVAVVVDSHRMVVVVHQVIPLRGPGDNADLAMGVLPSDWHST